MIETVKYVVADLINGGLDLMFPSGRKKKINGVDCVLPASIHRGIPNQIQQPMLDDLLFSCKNDNEIVFDIGAHIGTWSAIISASINKRGTVYSFEPNRHNFPVLKKHASVSPFNNIIPLQFAVSDKNGSISFIDKFSRKNRFGDSAKSKITNEEFRIDGDGSYQVQSIKIDTFVDQRKVIPTVIKVDVEGAEFQVLLGMKNLLKSNNVSLFIELHQFAWNDFQVSPTDFFNYAKDIGYKIYKNGKTRIDVPDEEFKDNLLCGYIKLCP